MNVLIIEDDTNKSTQIVQVLKSAYRDAQLECVRSYQSGLKAILEHQFDLIILDMSLPTYDISDTEAGFQFRPFGGREILNEMKRKRRPFRTLVLTQFETFGSGTDVTTLKELNAQLQREFADMFIGTIYYNASESNWKAELINAIGEAGQN